MTDGQQPANGTISILANGQTRTVRAGCTIAEFLQELSIAPRLVVAQLDGTIIAREQFGTTPLYEGCRLELVTMVGGG
ncbi:thiazole synthase/sulfur carrier protein [Thermosporothrix hazakensis]|jgi:thiamine biosynthesis protein ThiS|uniref:Thiazole synthase/sulfur carrier protein n=2 Tax=Thermosporothrix TaxID=768650 RepID=A0A326U2G6_THEHA|nr:sulfur carrier protein ThiS [Thermosporothrix hazakensis]PZW24213.1 thiazole synthase/sulfur carrier protein [Thermosporothrix hazakensis]BBH89658.1 hypothetical protein KTC_44090 [Thermosporothrix sp. COM3]GCE47844.1 hypothetical protein KTH_27130 [Thermosporothrix hazakensis]